MGSREAGGRTGPLTSSQVAANIALLKESIREEALQAGRDPEEIRFVLVTKTVPAPRILEAVEAGVVEFGENRVQELLARKKELPSHLNWHMVGHLQTNKVKPLLGEAALIHSLDRSALAEIIDTQAMRRDLGAVDCLIQVHSSVEESKAGFAPGEVAPFLASLKRDSRIRIRGLMTIGPLTEDAERIRRAFREIRELGAGLRRQFPERDWGILSMGMSADYRIAIREGANLLRIGTAVFGPRAHLRG